MSHTVIIELPGQVVAMDRRMVVRNGRPFMYTPAKAKHYQLKLKLMARMAMDGEPPLAGPISMRLWIRLPIMSSWNKQKRIDAASGALRATTKPDVDNCLKTIQDALTGIVFADDRQIVSLYANKGYSDEPGLRLEIEELQHDQRGAYS